PRQVQIRGARVPEFRLRFRQRPEGPARPPPHHRRPPPRSLHRPPPRQEVLARHPLVLTRPHTPAGPPEQFQLKTRLAPLTPAPIARGDLWGPPIPRKRGIPCARSTS